jgi:histidyl-tRNA synthetase
LLNLDISSKTTFKLHGFTEIPVPLFETTANGILIFI